MWYSQLVVYAISTAILADVEDTATSMYHTCSSAKKTLISYFI